MSRLCDINDVIIRHYDIMLYFNSHLFNGRFVFSS